MILSTLSAEALQCEINVCLFLFFLSNQAQLAQHWHCDQCVETTVVCDSEEAKRKHLDIYHQPMTCECGAIHELRAMQRHKREVSDTRSVSRV
jgi:hypothetical protein